MRHCLPATIAGSPDTANGTVLRAGTVAWASEAGFRAAELPIEHPLRRFYRLDPASAAIGSETVDGAVG